MDALREADKASGVEVGIRRRSSLRQRIAVFGLLLSDLLFGLSALGLAFGGSVFAEPGRQSVAEFVDVMLAGVVPSLVLWILLRLLLGLYPGYGMDPAQELRLQTYSSVLTLVVVLVILLAMDMGRLFFYLLPLAIFGLVLAVPVVRSGTKWVLRRANLWGKPVIILGEHDMAARLVRTMTKDREQGLRPVAVFSDVDEGDGTWPEMPESVPRLGDLESAPLFAHASGINTAVLAVRGLQRARTDELADWASTRFERVIVVPSLAGLTTSAIAARDLSGVLGVEVKHNLLDPRARRIKRVLDLAAATVGGALILPLVCLVALLIKLDSPGPALFIQERPGLNGRTFRIYKFRTMWTDAEQRVEELMKSDPVAREYFEKHGKIKDDLRVTRVGRWMRKFSLDELPQLWNVLKGEMSLVGPRPYLVSQVPQMSGAEMVILRILPGISGLWQVSGRSDLTFEQRIEMDSYYVRNWSVWLDLIILFRTVVSVLRRRGAV
jgi:Undecaprenyl-phosphate galactose phosphotransferase WbaP